MSIKYSAVIVVGLPTTEFGDDFIGEIRDINYDIELISPYYDAHQSHCILGFIYESSGDYSFNEIRWDHAKLWDLQQKFEAITGRRGKIYISTYDCSHG